MAAPRRPTIECPRCHGAGRRAAAPLLTVACLACHGSGRLREDGRPLHGRSLPEVLAEARAAVGAR